jgi:hypothetical protein
MVQVEEEYLIGDPCWLVRQVKEFIGAATTAIAQPHVD